MCPWYLLVPSFHCTKTGESLAKLHSDWGQPPPTPPPPSLWVPLTGHWQDAPGFLALHQPLSFYCLPSQCTLSVSLPPFLSLSPSFLSQTSKVLSLPLATSHFFCREIKEGQIYLVQQAVAFSTAKIPGTCVLYYSLIYKRAKHKWISQKITLPLSYIHLNIAITSHISLL